VTVGALCYPSLIDQLFRDHRDSAALKPGVTSQIRTRDGLMAANQIEHYAAVDVARRFARCNLKVGQINLSHFSAPCQPPTRSAVSLASPVLIEPLEKQSSPYQIRCLLIRGAN
jgi:hypothetical protein